MRSNNLTTTDLTARTPELRLVSDSGEVLEMPLESLSPRSKAALEAVEDVSRRIEDLATQLGCLGFFDQGDGPRAA